MAIREIYKFIQENHGKSSRDEILETLRAQGYPEDEIQTALMVEKYAEPYGKSQETRSGKSALPTIGELTLRGGREPLSHAKIFQEVPGLKRDAKQKGEFFTGFLLPLILYSFGFLLFSSRGTPYFPSWTAQLVLMWFIAVAAVISYLLLRAQNSDFVRGLPYGVVALLAIGFIALLLQHLQIILKVLHF